MSSPRNECFERRRSLTPLQWAFVLLVGLFVTPITHLIAKMLFLELRKRPVHPLLGLEVAARFWRIVDFITMHEGAWTIFLVIAVSLAVVLMYKRLVAEYSIRTNTIILIATMILGLLASCIRLKERASVLPPPKPRGANRQQTTAVAPAPSPSQSAVRRSTFLPLEGITS